jgi:hypothetical protein
LGDARVLYSKGEFEAAIAKHQEFLKDHPTSPDAFAAKVRCYLKQKNVDQAAKVADEGIAAINAGYPEAHPYLGLARERLCRRDLQKREEDDRQGLTNWTATIAIIRKNGATGFPAPSASSTWSPPWRATIPGTPSRSDVASYLKYLQERAKLKNTRPCQLVSKGASTEAPMVRLLEDPLHFGGYGLSVSLNGHKSSLMIDTGASGILVKRFIAEHAGISKITETNVSGIGKKGRRNAYVGIADSIKVGELEFQNCPIEVMESRSVGGDGIIGTDVVEDFLVDLRFSHREGSAQPTSPVSGRNRNQAHS